MLEAIYNSGDFLNVNIVRSTKIATFQTTKRLALLCDTQRLSHCHNVTVIMGYFNRWRTFWHPSFVRI